MYHCIALAASSRLHVSFLLLLLLLQGQAQIAEQIKRSYSTTDVSSDVTDGGGGGGGGGGRRRRDLDEYSFDDDDEAGVCVCASVTSLSVLYEPFRLHYATSTLTRH